MDPQLTRALSQASRVEILKRLAVQPASARQIAAASHEPIDDVLYHTSALHKAGCARPADPSETDPLERVYEIAIPGSARPRSPSDLTPGPAVPSLVLRNVCNGLAALDVAALNNGEAGLQCELLLPDEKARAIIDEAAERLEAARLEAAERIARNREKDS